LSVAAYILLTLRWGASAVGAVSVRTAPIYEDLGVDRQYICTASVVTVVVSNAPLRAALKAAQLPADNRGRP
jgi:hypothetical protein